MPYDIDNPNQCFRVAFGNLVFGITLDRDLAEKVMDDYICSIYTTLNGGVALGLVPNLAEELLELNGRSGFVGKLYLDKSVTPDTSGLRGRYGRAHEQEFTTAINCNIDDGRIIFSDSLNVIRNMNFGKQSIPILSGLRDGKQKLHAVYAERNGTWWDYDGERIEGDHPYRATPLKGIFFLREPGQVIL